MQRQLVRHLLGAYYENDIRVLKELLGVEKLELILMDSMEEMYALAPFLAEDPEVRPAEPEAPPV